MDIPLLQAELVENFLEADPGRTIHIARDHGAEFLGIGQRRVTIQDPDHPQRVLKLPWLEGGYADNLIELRLYQTGSDELRSVLCETYALSDEGALSMERCLPLAEPDISSEAERIVQILARHGISDGAANLGLLENGSNDLVCFDFALISPERFTELVLDPLAL